VACGGEARCRGRAAAGEPAEGRRRERKMKEGKKKRRKGKRKKRKGKEEKIEKGFRKLGKILGKLGERGKRIFANFSGFLKYRH
jgi:hypothetical protein